MGRGLGSSPTLLAHKMPLLLPPHLASHPLSGAEQRWEINLRPFQCQIGQISHAPRTFQVILPAELDQVPVVTSHADLTFAKATDLPPSGLANC